MVHSGPVLNETKRRMVSIFEETTLFFYTRNLFLKLLFSLLFPHGRLQDKNLLILGGI